jgi:hypothetical protein
VPLVDDGAGPPWPCGAGAPAWSSSYALSWCSSRWSAPIRSPSACSLPFRVTTAAVPAWFEHDAGKLPVGTAVLTIPFAYGIASRPMGWQAEMDDDFDLIGGWASVPGGNGVNDEVMSALSGPIAALRALSTNPRGLTAADQEMIRSALIRWRPLVVVVIPRYAKQGTVGAVTDILGFSPTRSDGAWVWTLNRSTPLGVDKALGPCTHTCASQRG